MTLINFDRQFNLIRIKEDNITGTDLPLIPRAREITYLAGELKPGRIFNILYPSHFQFKIGFISKLFQLFNLGNLIRSTHGSQDHTIINLNLINDSAADPEHYNLEIKPSGIEIRSGAVQGLFYGLISLVQILADNRKGIPAVRIDDRPFYRWRGLHLDVSRHFFPVEFIKKYLDLMALHKLNVFHWHLTDDNGWRIEINKYPELTEICAWRDNLEHLPWNKREAPVKKAQELYGGFYRQEEIKELVEYARERCITIVPEIEMPGHSREVFAAYPQFSCRGEKLTVAPGGYWPNRDIFCAGKDGSIDFIKTVLNEVIELFPSEYIHIGGDEADRSRWEECPFCQQRIRRNRLRDEKQLQSWFIRQIADFIRSRDRKMIAWDDILEGGLSGDETLMCWRGNGAEAAEHALFRNIPVVMTPNDALYFDWKQAEWPEEPGAFGVTSMKKVYSYSPQFNTNLQIDPKLILGLQGNVWTEYMTSGDRVEYMAYPRACALAEISWLAPGQKDFDGFSHRLSKHKTLLKKMRVNFCETSI